MEIHHLFSYSVKRLAIVCLCVSVVNDTNRLIILFCLHSHVVAPYNATITEVTMNNVVAYTCFAYGGPNNSYQWIRLRDRRVVALTQELTLNNTDPLDGGDYQCFIANSAGSDSALITLNGEICMIH